MNESYLWALGGGVLIGLSAIWMMLSLGRIAGISGYLKHQLTPPNRQSLWRLIFLVGLVIGAWLGGLIQPDLIFVRRDFSTWMLLASGFLVGLGTFWANGCTSGHGICGMARFSKRSITATLIFMAAAIVTVAIIRHGVNA